MPIHILQTIPILRIFDLEKAKAFYVGFLGFKVDWEHQRGEGAPIYLQISLGELRLHLSEHHGDGCPGAVVFVRVAGLAEYHAVILAKGYRFMRPGLEQTDHGSREIQVIDPFGNRIRFDESLGEKS